MTATRRKKMRRIVGWTAGILLTLFILLVIFVDRIVEPLLKDRIHTLIIQGSDSLYTYELGDLKANFFGGNVEVENLQINVDSARYDYLRRRNALPSLTIRLDLGHGHIKGLGIMALLFGKKIKIEEIMSKDANLKLTRNVRHNNEQRADIKVPIWKAIQPKINSIDIDRIRLAGIKMNYKNADTSESVKIEFEGCDALFSNIRIDSAAAFDTSRIGFTKDIQLRFQELKFRTMDSSYKLKAEIVTYSSTQNILAIEDFKFQPTLDSADFYKNKTIQESMYDLRFHKARFTGFHLDHFIRNNIIDADSAIIQQPVITINNDRSLQPTFTSKIGKYPHQQLLKAASTIIIKNILISDARVVYTERNDKTLQEGKLNLEHLNISASNVTNDSVMIKRNPICLAKMQTEILGSSPMEAVFKFYLDTTNGKYEAEGNIKNINATQLNTLAVPLANVQINSFDIHTLSFQVRGEDYEATANVQMRYNNLAVTLRKTDEETGEVQTKKFLTKVLNKFVLFSDNPGPDGVERTAINRRVSRLTTQSFLGFLWKSIFAGMQDVMMKSGRYG